MDKKFRVSTYVTIHRSIEMNRSIEGVYLYFESIHLTKLYKKDLVIFSGKATYYIFKETSFSLQTVFNVFTGESQHLSIKEKRSVTADL